MNYFRDKLSPFILQDVANAALKEMSATTKNVKGAADKSCAEVEA